MYVLDIATLKELCTNLADCPHDITKFDGSFFDPTATTTTRHESDFDAFLVTVNEEWSGLLDGA